MNFADYWEAVFVFLSTRGTYLWTWTYDPTLICPLWNHVREAWTCGGVL